MRHVPFILAAGAIGASALPTLGAILYDAPGTSYTQNFDSLVGGTWVNNSTLPGWHLFRRPAPGVALTSYSSGTGSSNTGSFYSFGTAANERALGGVGSGGTYFGSPGTGTVAGWMAVAFQNQTGATQTQFAVGFDGEQWRNGGNTTAQTMVMEYGFGSDFTTVANWVAPGSAFNFTSVVNTASAAAVDGNSTGRVAGLGGTVDAINWANGDTLWIRWIENNDAGNDHGLAIDNFSFSTVAGGGGPVDPPPPPPVPTPVAFNADGIIGAGNEAPLIGATQLPTPGSLPAGDGFQIFQRGVNDGLIPFALLDDSLVIFPGDTQGIVRNADTNAFFGVTDLVNGEPLSEINPGDGTGTADFKFNITGMTDIQIAIDMAAMGDFENSNDRFDFTYSIDGSTFQTLFASSVDEAGVFTYFLEGGASFLIDDPLLMNGTMLTNLFQTLTADVLGTGSELTLRFFATTEGGSEAFAFRNIEVTSANTTGGPAAGAIPEPTTGILALAGFVILVNRRHRKVV